MLTVVKNINSCQITKSFRLEYIFFTTVNIYILIKLPNLFD